MNLGRVLRRLAGRELIGLRTSGSKSKINAKSLVHVEKKGALTAVSDAEAMVPALDATRKFRGSRTPGFDDSLFQSSTRVRILATLLDGSGQRTTARVSKVSGLPMNVISKPISNLVSSGHLTKEGDLLDIEPVTAQNALSFLDFLDLEIQLVERRLKRTIHSTPVAHAIVRGGDDDSSRVISRPSYKAALALAITDGKASVNLVGRLIDKDYDDTHQLLSNVVEKKFAEPCEWDSIGRISRYQLTDKGLDLLKVTTPRLLQSMLRAQRFCRSGVFEWRRQEGGHRVLNDWFAYGRKPSDGQT